MITVIDEEKMVLRNYDRMIEAPIDEMFHYIVEYNWSLDRKPIIEYASTMGEEMFGYHKDII